MTAAPEHRIFPTASEDVGFACSTTLSPQTQHLNYRLAFTDMDFLLRDELRPVRLQLELLKAELALQELGIESTLVFYGSARIPEPGDAAVRLQHAKTADEKMRAERIMATSHYYPEARALAQLASQVAVKGPEHHFVVVSGGGPSFMEAANRGAADVGAPSVGLNIVLPHEQLPNGFVTPALSFQFHYFALRKMHFMMRARAIAVFPGGFGTLDELFEALTLIQTGKIAPIPLLLFGRSYWERIINFQQLVDEGVISPEDLTLFRFVETGKEAWDIIAEHYKV
jgi:uncharacterized protein (TIGR00730 family)